MKFWKERKTRWIAAICAALCAGMIALPVVAQESVETFAPLAQWKAAIVAGDAQAVSGFYSTNPAVIVFANGVRGDHALDDAYWIGLKPRALKITPIASQVRHGFHQLIFSVEVTGGDGKTLIVTDQQSWQQQGSDWSIVSVIRTDAPVLKQPSSMSKDLYPASADAHADLLAAEKKAVSEHKRVLLVFGANWCFDCHVLDLAFQRPDLAAVLGSNYEVVHIDLGPDGKKNADVVTQFQIPLNKGVPAVAVAESDGTLVASQKNGEFENARGMTPDAMLAFLNQWKVGKD
jgi:hypothetical protein